jgi:GAF domain-containing protein/HAMP domain-containing protein
LAEQEQAEALRPLSLTLGTVVGVDLLSVILAVGAALFLSRSIAEPLAGLAQTATEIVARADAGVAGGIPSSDVYAAGEREDEIGTLARAFDSMTHQLRDLIAGLERRVQERTQELDRRSRYLEAAGELGRTASSILNADELMHQVVESIRDRFDLYYVGLFLVDQTPALRGPQWAVLQANAGAPSALPALGGRLPIGSGSMIGWCIANGVARVALEAGQDAERLAEPELPDTRSEAALPLRSRGEVIGALTVQHTAPGAFDPAVVAVLQTMADQVAVALDNARLFAERQEALEAAQRAYGELSHEAWLDILQARPAVAFRSDESGVVPVSVAPVGADQWSSTLAGTQITPEAEQALRTGRTVQAVGPSERTDSRAGDSGAGDSGAGDSDGKRTLAVPIKVRGEVVGVLDTYKPAATGDWTADEIALLEAIAEQLDPALESARLYQDTQRRAAREQAIRLITDRMRRAVDVEAVVQNTLVELARALGAPRAYVRLGVGGAGAQAPSAVAEKLEGTEEKPGLWRGAEGGETDE